MKSLRLAMSLLPTVSSGTDVAAMTLSGPLNEAEVSFLSFSVFNADSLMSFISSSFLSSSS